MEEWSRALDPVLSQFVSAAEGKPDVDFWKSFFRYHGGSGSPVMTGWIYLLFPYLKDKADKLYPNPYLNDWKRRLEKDQAQHFRESRAEPQGVGMRAVPSALASVPVKVVWGSLQTDMRFVGGLIGLARDLETLALEPQCGWAILFDESEEVLAQKLGRYWFRRVTG